MMLYQDLLMLQLQLHFLEQVFHGHPCRRPISSPNPHGFLGRDGGDGDRRFDQLPDGAIGDRHWRERSMIAIGGSDGAIGDRHWRERSMIAEPRWLRDL